MSIKNLQAIQKLMLERESGSHLDARNTALYTSIAKVKSRGGGPLQFVVT